MYTTQPQQTPPNNGGNVATLAGFEDDDIPALGDQIAALTMLEAKELSDYLKTKGINIKKIVGLFEV